MPGFSLLRLKLNNKKVVRGCVKQVCLLHCGPLTSKEETLNLIKNLIRIFNTSGFHLE